MDYSDFDIGPYGFLPSQPAHTFQDPYYRPWDDLASKFPLLLSSKLFRAAVQALPSLSTARLKDVREWQRAYVLLGFFTHGYVWVETPAAERVPPSLAKPFLAVCTKLRIAPVATYACLCLWNFRLIDQSKPHTDPANLKSLITFTGSRAESWFYVMSDAIEAQGGRFVTEFAAILQSPNPILVTSALQRLATALESMAATVTRMSEHLEPDHFYNVIRPWMSGFKNASAQGLPKGIIFEDGTGHDKYYQLAGGSNGQTTLLPFFDLVLGIKHSDENRNFITEMHGYMPGRHVDFLKTMNQYHSFRNIVANYPNDKDLHQAYNNAIESLKALRSNHVNLVTRYIVIPSRNASLRQDSGDVQGTAGTSLMPFLKSMREESGQAKLCETPI